MAHVARRAGVRGEAPAPALSDSFEGGEAAFMKAFREEVTADTEQRELRRPRLSGRRIGLLCLALLVPAGTLALALTAAHQRYPPAYPAGHWPAWPPRRNVPTPAVCRTRACWRLPGLVSWHG